MVYFVQCLENGLIKIGFTDKPVRYRMLEIAYAKGDVGPWTLRLLGLVAGSLADEQALHDRFTSSRAAANIFPPFRGECFEPTSELLAYIGSLPPSPQCGLTVSPRKHVPRAPRRCRFCRSDQHEANRCPMRFASHFNAGAA